MEEEKQWFTQEQIRQLNADFNYENYEQFYEKLMKKRVRTALMEKTTMFLNLKRQVFPGDKRALVLIKSKRRKRRRSRT